MPRVYSKKWDDAEELAKMNLTMNYFSLTTAQEESNYFSGENQEQRSGIIFTEIPTLATGDYRVIDGELCRIVSGLNTVDLRDRLQNKTESK